MNLSKASIFVLTITFAVVANAENIWVKVKQGSWEPNEQVVTTMKASIGGYVRNEAKRQKRELLKWDEYMFQYLAAEDKGQKYILINAICGKKTPQELESFIFTSGGGNCYFSLNYYPEKKRFSELSINGAA